MHKVTGIIKTRRPCLKKNMNEQERQRIYDLLNAKTKSRKISEITVVSLWPPSSLDLNPLDNTRWSFFRKQNKCNFPSKYWFT